MRKIIGHVDASKICISIIFVAVLWWLWHSSGGNRSGIPRGGIHTSDCAACPNAATHGRERHAATGDDATADGDAATRDGAAADGNATTDGNATAGDDAATANNDGDAASRRQ